jgi:hypothetical protein
VVDRRQLRLLVGAVMIVPVPRVAAVASQFHVQPASIVLADPAASQQLVVSVESAGGASSDVTRTVSYELSQPKIATIDQRGLVRPLAEGRTEIVIRDHDSRLVVPVEVKGLRSPPPVSFAEDIIPILTKAGCNSGGCHGKAEGQNGFKMSIFGFDPAADFGAIVKAGRGRRVWLSAPERSLLLLKATAQISHGGGQIIEPDGYHHERLRRWISEGARFATDVDEQRRIVGIEVEPEQPILLARQSQQLRVTAVDAAGHRRCVTVIAAYESNAETIAEVDSLGLVQAGDVPGEAVILVRYLGHVSLCQVTLPRREVAFQRPPEINFIDRLVWDKLQRLGIIPSEIADDAMFMRRVYLDTIGTLPTAAEARAFLSDPSSDKRGILIDELLERDEYADYWTMQWLNLLRADQLKTSPQGALAIQRWLRRAFAENRPYDELAREILTVRGNTSAAGPGSFYKVVEQPDELGRSLSQLLLGVRIECAQCHHHPSERWSQEDYVGLAGFFTGVKLKSLPAGKQAIVSEAGNDLPHPRTGELIPARALGATPADFSDVPDRRMLLADWMTAADNPYFAKAIANRVWAHYFGRGLIEPIDDIRDTNPATNAPLMRALTDHLREVGYDLKQFTRTLLNSRVYQLSSVANSSNADDYQNFSHAAYKSLPAEVLLDAICQSTGVDEKFNGWPGGYRAIQVWDNRMPSYFFRIFGRPLRTTVCECERGDEPSIAQALHLLNSPEIGDKISSRCGVARKLATSDTSEDEIIEELYLQTLSRFPEKSERRSMLRSFADAGTDRRAAAEDVLWALLNSKEYLFNH